MLSAAVVLLVQRTTEPRAASGLAQAAKRRSALTRGVWTFESASRVVIAGRDAGVIGTITTLAYDDMAVAPMPGEAAPRERAHAILASGLRLVVPFKHLASQGATEGAAIWVRGKPTSDAFEVAQEGLGEAARTVWEDYLAVLARPAFDLAPGTIFAEWELPARSAKRRVTDLLARIRKANRA